jgi:hypothetical protein
MIGTRSIEKAATADTQTASTQETLFLVGRPTLKEFLRFARVNAVDPPGAGTLADQWRSAHALVGQLAGPEAGRADDPPIVGLSVREHEPLLAEFLKNPLVRHGFNLVPTEVAFVELDRLVVWQKHIDLTHARRVEAGLQSESSPEQIFRACLAPDHPQPPVTWASTGEGRYTFVSRSSDLRTLGVMSMKPHNIRGIPPPGDVVGVVGMAVGFGSNFLSAIHVENRLLLHNGSHRAYALRKIGLKRVPCIVQHVSSRDELELVASSEVRRHPDRYLKDPRPSMLADYFNPGLHTVMQVRSRLRQITVRVEVDETYVPAL